MFYSNPKEAYLIVVPLAQLWTLQCDYFQVEFVHLHLLFFNLQQVCYN